MEQKKNDYFLNAITNPTFSPENFYSIGITAENTSFQDSKAYKNLEFIHSFPAFQTNGQFDEQKFQQSYLAAADGFQKLSQRQYQVKYSRVITINNNSRMHYT